MMKKIVIVEQKGVYIKLLYKDEKLEKVSLSLTGNKKKHFPSSKNQKEIKDIQRYFSKSVDEFSKLTLDLSGYTEMERKVLSTMRRIPFGKTVSYKELAHMSGNSRMSRFVGNVCAKNRFPLLIPCHRVIKSDGSLGGYSGGLKIKEKLLNFEAS